MSHPLRLETRVDAIESTLGEQTNATNQRLTAIETSLQQQTKSINDFIAAMTAPKQHQIPAISSPCRVVAKVT